MHALVQGYIGWKLRHWQIGIGSYFRYDENKPWEGAQKIEEAAQVYLKIFNHDAKWICIVDLVWVVFYSALYNLVYRFIFITKTSSRGKKRRKKLLLN